MQRGYCLAMTGGSRWKIRTGKSETAIMWAKLVDPSFDCSRIIYRPTDLLKILNKIGKNKDYGKAIVVDEAEELVANTGWQSAMNKAISLAIATGGFRRTFIIWVTPTFDWIDKKIRKLINGWGSTEMHLDQFHKKRCTLRFFEIGTDDSGEKIFKHTPKFYDHVDGRVVHANKFEIKSLQEVFPELRAEYIEKSTAFKEELNTLLYEIVKTEENSVLKNKSFSSESVQLLVDSALQYPIVKTSLADKGKVTVAQVRYSFLNDGKTLPERTYKDIANGINFTRKINK